MKIEEQIIELLENGLDDKDRVKLEELMDANPGLKQDKALYEQIILAIRKKGEDELRADLDEYLKDHLEGQKGKRVWPLNKYVTYIGVAASISLAILFFYPSNNNSPGDLPKDWEINSKPAQRDSSALETDSLKNIPDSLNVK